jgi:hypothetical protein
MPDDKRLRRIWNQQKFPVLLRREQGRLRVRVPYDPKDILWLGRTQYWLRSGRHNIPEWFPVEHYWEVPANWFNALIQQLLNRFSGVYVIQPFREQEVCASQCWNAKGHECECSCMGANHGQGKHGQWLEISETFATRWGPSEIACLFMTKKT